MSVNKHEDQRNQLKARAESMGLNFEVTRCVDTGAFVITDPKTEAVHKFSYYFSWSESWDGESFNKKSVDAAHAFLDGLLMVRGSVVEIKHSDDRFVPLCMPDCYFFHGCRWHKGEVIGRGTLRSVPFGPGPDCPIHTKPGPDYEARIVWLPVREEGK